MLLTVWLVLFELRYWRKCHLFSWSVRNRQYHIHCWHPWLSGVQQNGWTTDCLESALMIPLQTVRNMLFCVTYWHITVWIGSYLSPYRQSVIIPKCVIPDVSSDTISGSIQTSVVSGRGHIVVSLCHVKYIMVYVRTINTKCKWNIFVECDCQFQKCFECWSKEKYRASC